MPYPSGDRMALDEQCKALLPGKTRARCASRSDQSNDFCPSHKEELGRLVRTYKDASGRAKRLKPTAVTTADQLCALYNTAQAASRADDSDLKAAEAATVEYLDAVRAELKGRTAVSERFYANGEQDGHHYRIRNLANEEAAVAALLVSLRARTRIPVPRARQPLQPKVVNVSASRAAPAQRDREYIDRQYTRMPMDYDYGPRVYGQPAGKGGSGPSFGTGVLRFLIYAAIAYGAYKVSKSMLLVARDLCRDIGSGKVGDFARETLSLPVDPSELLKFKDDALENAKDMLENAGKEIMGRSTSAWTSLSELAAKGIEGASDAVASSVNDPGQAAKDVAEGLSEAREWVVERSGPLWTTFSKFVEDGTKAASEAVASVVDEVKARK